MRDVDGDWKLEIGNWNGLGGLGEALCDEIFFCGEVIYRFC